MLTSKFSGVVLASLLAIGSLGMMADAASAKPDNKPKKENTGGGQSIGSCSVNDVNLFTGEVAVDCKNFTGNDDIDGFEAFGQTWTFYGKDEAGEGETVSLDPSGGSEVKSGTWSVDEDLADYAESLVVVLKAANYHSAYLFENLSQYNQAVKTGTFNVAGVTAGGKAGLSHLSIYYAPRVEVPDPPTVPEPVLAIGLLTFAGMSSRLKRG